MDGLALTRADRGSRVEDRGSRTKDREERVRSSILDPRYSTFYPRIRVLSAALLSAGLLWLCYFPLAWGWLAWIALVPLLSLVRSHARPRAIYLSAWVCGLAFFWPVLQWMRVADYRMYFTWAALATYCSLYVPLTIFLVRRLDRGTRLPLVVTLPIVWAGLEYLRSFLMTGFAWYFLGHTQHDFLALIQMTDLGGVYLVTMLIAAVNAWLFELLCKFAWFREIVCQSSVGQDSDPVARWTGSESCPTRMPGVRRLWLIVQTIALVLCFSGALVYGNWRLSQEDEFRPGPLVALLQSNIDQRLRNVDASATDADADRARRSMLQEYGLLVFCAKNQKPRPPDLIVWPETSHPETWFEIAPTVDLHELHPEWARVQAVAHERFRGMIIRPSGTNNLVGVQARVIEDPKKSVPEKYNSAVLLRDDGSLGGRYDKIHRVPFGEYVPLRDWLPFMESFAPSEYEKDYSIRAGDKFTRFTITSPRDPRTKRGGEYHFGVLICYEDTDPHLARQYSQPGEHGPAVDFLINISNDGWFDGTSEHEEHLAICRFRAIESRRAVARSVNMGISAVIDGNGRIRSPAFFGKYEGIQRWAVDGTDTHTPDLPMSAWGRYKKVPGVLTAIIPLDTRESFYAQWGDWLPQTCWAVLGLGLVWAIWTRRRRASTALLIGVEDRGLRIEDRA